jgi:hypothetical protein
MDARWWNFAYELFVAESGKWINAHRARPGYEIAPLRVESSHVSSGAWVVACKFLLGR